MNVQDVKKENGPSSAKKSVEFRPIKDREALKVSASTILFSKGQLI
ncbi:hypothetical protein [Lentzea kentuckyensis]|nr:hypothetical protein [Lentzea kentuckyensis]